MSNTYKDKKKGYINSQFRATNNYSKAWDEYQNNPKYGLIQYWAFYNKNPSWWNHEFSTKPSRAKQRNLLKKIDIDNCEEYWDFPDYKKPYLYYW